MTAASLDDDDISAIDSIWQCIRKEAQSEAALEPILSSHLHATVLNHQHFSEALAFHLANLLGCKTASPVSYTHLTLPTKQMV